MIHFNYIIILIFPVKVNILFSLFTYPEKLLYKPTLNDGTAVNDSAI